MVTFVVAVGVGACGGTSDKDAAATATGDFLAAYSDGDGAAACEQLTAEAQTYVVSVAAARRLGSLDCSAALTQLAGTTGHAQRELFGGAANELEPDDVQISGNTATVTVPRTTVSVSLQDEGGWKLTGAAVQDLFAASGI